MWLFGRSSTSDSDSGPLNEATHAERQRSKQISWLREKVGSVAELERDRRYQTKFNVKETTITLDIFLSERFPFEGPQVTASPHFAHPWVDSRMVVIGCPSIQQFTPHSNLGAAVKEIINELTSHPPHFGGTSMATIPPYPVAPPVPAPYTGPGPEAYTGSYAPPVPFPMYSYSSFPQPVVPLSPSSSSPSIATRALSSSSLTDSSFSPHTVAGAAAGSVSYSSYTIPDKLPGISEKTDEQLEQYLSDEDAIVQINRFISKQEVIKKIQDEMESLFQRNEELAKRNMELEPQLQTEWGNLQDKLIELQSLKENYDQLQIRHGQLTEKYSKNHMLMKLKTVRQDAETESDMIADDFLEQKVDSSAFLQRYLQERKIYHLRSAKMEILQYQRS